MSDRPPVEDYSVTGGTYPPEFVDNWPWFCWAYDEGRKIPRAPWADSTNGIETWVSWKDPEIWTDHETAAEWAEHIDQLSTASCLPALDADEQRPIFFDFDDVRDPETGAIHPEAWRFIVGEDRPTLHAAVSSSGTGIHGFALVDRIPADRKPTWTLELDPWEFQDELDAPELEVYAANRFVGLTGRHIDETPVELPDVTETVLEMFDEFADELRAGDSHEPDLDAADLEDLDTTTNIDDVLDAISLVEPGDIRLRSTKTGERADGSISYDPSFAQSESGTRLAAVGDGWVWRQGMVGLDALQVTAAEERIITARDLANGVYPEGDDFWEAVDELRKRGARIPEYVADGGTTWARRDVEESIEPGAGPDDDGAESLLDRLARAPAEWVNGDAQRWTIPASEPDADALAADLEAGRLPVDEEQLGEAILDGVLDPDLERAVRSFRDEPHEWDVEIVDDETTAELTLDSIAAELAVAPGDLGSECTRPEIATAFWAALKESRELLIVGRNGENSDGTLFCYDAEAGVWTADGEMRLRDLAQDVLGRHYSTAVAAEIEDRARNELVPGEPLGAKPADQFETPPGWIPAANGDIRFTERGRERELYDPEPFRGGHLIEHRLPVEFDPSASCPRFEEFLDDIIPRPADRRKIQEFVGYTLLSWGLPFHKSLFLVGPQASGKSTLLELVETMLGERNVANLSPHQLADERFSGYQLLGKWANVDQDVPSGRIENLGAWKKLAAGDRMKAEQKHKPPIFFEPSAKQLYAANQVPAASIDDAAFYRRVLLASAPNSIPPEEQIPAYELRERLEAELSGVLNWALDGLERLLEQGGFTDDLPPHETREKWEAWGNSAKRFVQQAIATPPEANASSRIARTELFDRYEEWVRQHGLPAESRRELYRTMRQKQKVTQKRARVDGRTTRVFAGVELIDDEFGPEDAADDQDRLF